jgi:hypothetical protein
MSIITSMRDMLVCFEDLEPVNNKSCVTTAPTVPPLPVIPDFTPNGMQKPHLVLPARLYYLKLTQSKVQTKNGQNYYLSHKFK